MARTFELEQPLGRDEELVLADGLLRATLADASQGDSHVRALLVGGDAGIGKTTLVHAVGARAAALGLGFTVGHCLDLATGPPFGPVTEALRAIVDQIGTRLDVVPAPAGWLAADAPGSSEGSLESLLLAAEALARAAPFVLTLEDLHWADTTVRDFTLALLRTCRAPLLLVLTLRRRAHPAAPGPAAAARADPEPGHDPSRPRMSRHGGRGAAGPAAHGSHRAARGREPAARALGGQPAPRGGAAHRR